MKILGINGNGQNRYSNNFIVMLSEREIGCLFSRDIVSKMEQKQCSLTEDIDLEPKFLENNQAKLDQFKLENLKKSLKTSTSGL